MPRVTRRHPTPPTFFLLQPAQKPGEESLVDRATAAIMSSGKQSIFQFALECILGIMQLVHESAISRFLAR